MGQVDCQALSRVLLDQRQHLERWTIVHTEMYEVIAPDLITMTRPQANTRTIIQQQSTAFRLPFRDFQACATSHVFDAFMVHLPTFST